MIERQESDQDIVLQPLLLDVWQTMLRWRLLIVAIIAACLAIGLVVTLLMPPLFTARSQIEISREQKNVTNVQGLDSQQEGRDLEFYATQYSLLEATSLAERVVRRLDLAKGNEFFDAHGQTFDDEALDARLLVEQRERAARELLLKNISIKPIRTSRLVDVTYTSRSADMSARITNAWIAEFIGSTMDRQFASTADARKFLEQRLAALRLKLEESERSAVVYATGRDIVTLDSTRDDNGRTNSQRTLAAVDLEALNKSLLDARADRIAAESRTGSGSAENSTEVLTNPAIGQLRARRAELASEYANLMARFEPGYPAAKAIQNSIQALDAALARESGRVTGSRNLAYSEALARENALQQQVNALKVALDRQQRDAIQYNIYQRDADTNRQLYDALLQRYKEIGIAGTVGASNVAIVDVAERPARPSSPRLLLNMAVALIAGMALATMAVFAIEQIDQGIRNPEDIRRKLKMPLLGNVPLVEHDPIGELANPKSFVSESYFSIRSALTFATPHGLPRSFAISSSRSGEGKSTSALAFAEVIGRTGKRVLLIDADMRSPSLHAYLGGDNKQGLSNILADENMISPIIQQTGWKGVSLISSGPLPPSPAELLSTDRLAEMISTLLKEYDHVLVDAPPVLGIADAPLIGRAVEGVVFMVEAERTPRRVIVSSLERLQTGGAKIFGVIVSKMDISRHGYGYGYGYEYNYGINTRWSESGSTAT